MPDGIPDVLHEKQNENQAAKPASSISANNNKLSCTIDAKKLDMAVCFVGLRTSFTLLTRKREASTRRMVCPRMIRAAFRSPFTTGSMGTPAAAYCSR